jgi:glycosyltransferase involved in cell wall biosynthesis
MPPRVTVVAASSVNPMGQQVFESGLREALAESEADWDVRWLNVGSMRTADKTTRRLPMRLADSFGRSLLGRLGYGHADVVHRLDLRLPPAGPGRPEVLTVHDCAPWRYPDEGRIPPHARADVAHARVVTAPSAFAAGEIAELLGRQDVAVIPNGVDTALLDVRPDLVLARRLGLPRTFVLHAGGASQRKNLGALAAAWRLVQTERSDVGLALCGPRDPRRDAAFADIDGAHLLGRLPRWDLLGLMAAAAAIVVPSRYEGFGLPVLEAMAVGAPVVAARAGALPEACGDAGLLVEPTTQGLAGGLIRVLSDPTLAVDLTQRGRRRAAVRDWMTVARSYLRIYQSVLG